MFFTLLEPGVDEWDADFLAVEDEEREKNAAEVVLALYEAVVLDAGEPDDVVHELYGEQRHAETGEVEEVAFLDVELFVLIDELVVFLLGEELRHELVERVEDLEHHHVEDRRHRHRQLEKLDFRGVRLVVQETGKIEESDHDAEVHSHHEEAHHQGRDVLFELVHWADEHLVQVVVDGRTPEFTLEARSFHGVFVVVIIVALVQRLLCRKLPELHRELLFLALPRIDRVVAPECHQDPERHAHCHERHCCARENLLYDEHAQPCQRHWQQFLCIEAQEREV